MKLLRLKITDPKGFRSLQSGFELNFRRNPDEDDISLDDETITPYVCAGPNGSGKSNLLEVLAAIFFQLEVLRTRRNFLPSNFIYDENENPNGFKEGDGYPNAYALEYLILEELDSTNKNKKRNWAHIKITKELNTPISMVQVVKSNDRILELSLNELKREKLLPEYILGYSSGENQILSLPFFKMRFIQYDEYRNSLKEQLAYTGRPDGRMAYLDQEYSQAILLSNLLIQEKNFLASVKEDIGLQDLKEFRLIIKRTININKEDIFDLVSESIDLHQLKGTQDEIINEIIRKNPAIEKIEKEYGEEYQYRLNLIRLFEKSDTSDHKKDPVIERFKRCATFYFEDEAENSLYLDYYVNEATKEAFKVNFDFEEHQSPIALFQAFQVLLTLNLYAVSDRLKSEIYKSESLYVSETVPVLASDQKIFQIENVCFTKKNIEGPVLLKSLSDGEHQLLHSLGLCMLFKNTNSLFLLDEPETHFNPDWRSNFISRIKECFDGSKNSQEMLITTHTPFLISDSKPDKVLEFNKDDHGMVRVNPPDYNTFGASINKITMSTFNKQETIGAYAQEEIKKLHERFKKGEDKEVLLKEINDRIGDSVEKVLLVKTILDSMES